MTRNVEVVETCSECGTLDRVPLRVDPSWDAPLALAAQVVGGLPHRALGCSGTVETAVEEVETHRRVEVTNPDFRYEQ
jgi:hypothetical protein